MPVITISNHKPPIIGSNCAYDFVKQIPRSAFLSIECQDVFLHMSRYATLQKNHSIPWYGITTLAKAVGLPYRVCQLAIHDLVQDRWLYCTGSAKTKSYQVNMKKVRSAIAAEVAPGGYASSVD